MTVSGGIFSAYMTAFITEFITEFKCQGRKMIVGGEILYHHLAEKSVYWSKDFSDNIPLVLAFKEEVITVKPIAGLDSLSLFFRSSLLILEGSLDRKPHLMPGLHQETESWLRKLI